VGINFPVNASFTCADIPLTNDIWLHWETAALFAVELGDSEGVEAWPLIYDVRFLERALSMCHVNWDVSEAELASMCFGSYRLEKDGREVFYNTPKSAQCITKSLIAARLPHLVEKAEVHVLLAMAEVQFADLWFESGTTGVSLSVICSVITQHLGDKHHALMYAKTELTSNLNPLKQTHAQMALGVTQCITDTDEE
jgi:hypothetical protein